MRSNRLRITFNSPVILSMVAISFVATLLGYLSGGYITELVFMTYRASLLSPLTWIRAFAHIFGHADWSHLVGNMSYILLFGPLLEEKYGSKTLVFVTAITAFMTSLVNFCFFPNVGLCGASGIVFAFIILSSFTSFREGEIPLTFILVAVLFIGQQIFEGLVINDNISNTAHILGGIVGGLIGYALNKQSVES
ncbi:MAG: rhomboid family intramembrane serine protease [Lachnospiraceae bacterium]|nr:rhomboid family intramembrane serine protease [Lachnospiraceae bacterium]